MEEKKEPMKERLKKDIVIFVIIMFLLGGTLASFLVLSPYAPYLIIGFVLLTFGPYALEYAQEKMNKKRIIKRSEGKIIFTGFTDEKGNKIISMKSKCD